jgi:hypothetical protein
VGQEFLHMLKVIIMLSRECRQLPNESSKIDIHENSRSDDVIITQVAVLRGAKSGLCFVAKVKGKMENSADETTTSNMKMEVEAVSGAS